MIDYQVEIDKEVEFFDQFDKWYGMDTENDENGKVTLVALVDEFGWSKVWYDTEGFKTWCDMESAGKNATVVICHNLEYDLVNIFGYEYGWLNLTYLGTRLISARYQGITFYDSLNHFQMPLKKLGEQIGIEKKAFDIHSVEYVTTDALICLKAITKARDFMSSLGGKLGATSGSSSTSVWRYMTQDDYLLGPVDNEWLRQSYYGGRTELFRTEARGTIRAYDINSMYPYCMTFDYPEYLVSDKRFQKDKGIVEATVFVPLTETIGPLPKRMEETGRLVFPIGKFSGLWTYDELRFAESVGTKILKVKKAFGCNTLIKPFEDYINTIYKLRKNATDPAEKLFLKLLMNTLYGKLAAKNEITRTVGLITVLEKYPHRLEDVKWINAARGLLEYKTPPQRYVNVPWGSYVTSYARILLQKYLRQCPPEKLIYCDTDSLYCVDYELPTSDELGEMKLESTGGYMKVKQPKAYQVDDHFKAKGVPRPKLDENGDIVIDFAREFFETGCVAFSQPVRFKESLVRKNLRPNQWIEKTKSMITEYKHKDLRGQRYYPVSIEE